FGLEAAPEGMTPAGYFMEALFEADRDVYQDILSEIVTTHGEKLLPHVEDAVFAKHGIPKDRLEEVKNFLQFGSVSATETARKEFVQLLKPELAGGFSPISRAAQDWFPNPLSPAPMPIDLPAHPTPNET